MTRYGEATRTAGPKAKAHPGFTRDGGFFRSDTPVHGALTEFVRRAITLVAGGASPRDVILHLAVEPPDVRAVFVGVAGQWSGLTRAEDWGLAFTSCSAHEAIKRKGGGC